MFPYPDESQTPYEIGQEADDSVLTVIEPEMAEVPPTASVWAEGITQVGDFDDGRLACFDVCFVVGICDAELGQTKTFKILKRIAVDKTKIAAEASNFVPISVVEDKSDEAPLLEEKVDQRALRMAGLR